MKLVLRELRADHRCDLAEGWAWACCSGRLRALSREFPSAVRRYLPLVGIVLGAAVLAAYYAVPSPHWFVMTDELQTSKLATSIAETFSPTPRIHGEIYRATSQLYPLLIAPFFGLFSAPDAVAAAHALNAALLASAALPAYLLAYAVTRSRAAGVAAAALTAFVPWLVLASMLLTENAAYPAFVWAVFLMHRTFSAPTFSRDIAAIAGLSVAFLARAQLLVLVLALPVALLAHELGYASAAAPSGERLKALRAAMRRAVLSHPLLVIAYAVAGAAAAALAVAVGLGGLTGTYAGTFQGDLLPEGIWHSAATHLAYVAVGVGMVPALLASAWALTAIVRPGRKEAHAFAALLLTLTPLLILEVASFDLRFSPGGFNQDRYLCYLAPLFSVGTAAALLDREERVLRATIVVAAGALFAWLASFASFAGDSAIFWASPGAAFHGGLETAGGWIALSADSLVRWGTLSLAAILAVVIWRVPGRTALLVTSCAVAAFGGFEAGYVFDRFVPRGASPGRDWIDAAVPRGRSVALVPNPYLAPFVWWDAEFWNKRVDRVLQVGNGPTFTPFPAEQLAVDMRTGRTHGSQRTPFLALASTETRFHLVGTTVLAQNGGMALVSVQRPYRADWATRGAYPDGWTRPGRPVELRFFPARGPSRIQLTVVLSAPGEANGGLQVMLRSADALRRGLVFPTTALRLRVPVCIPRDGFGAATLVAPKGVRIPDERVVGVHVDAVYANPTGSSC